jgi:uncharacterized protein (DUF433 family)
MNSTNSAITVDPAKRFGKPCVRDTRIAVVDVLDWLASGMSYEEISADFPQISRDDILACLRYAAERENHTSSLAIAA